MKNPQSNLPPGFRFHPTDEELILHYLKKKITSTPFPVSIIADVDIYKFNPWDLPAKAAFGEKEWYFFSPRDRKYPNGARPNRAAASGYWKATGTDKVITASTVAATGGGGGGGGVVQENIGVKKALVFYKGRPPKGIKTNWIMHEYRLADAPNFNHRPIKPKDSTTMRLDDWVLCRIYKKTHASPPLAAAETTASDHDQEEEEEVEHQQKFAKENLLPSFQNPIITSKSLMPQKSSSFSNLLDAMDYSLLRSFLSDNNQFNTTGYDSTPTLNTTAIPDQPLFVNCNPTPNSSSSYLLQKLPQLNNNSNNNPSALMTNMGNKLQKRPLCTIDEDLYHHNPSKKFVGSCSFTNSTSQSDLHIAHNQYGFLNQQLLLSPHFQFQG